MELVLQGPEMVAVSFGILIVLWVMILWASRAFGSPPEH